MFDSVAQKYDRANDLLSFGQTKSWRGKVRKAVDPQAGQAILDLAAGTGSSSIAFVGEGIRVVASDFSQGMLAEGRKRHPELEFVFADATKLPFKNAEFDATTISFGLRNTQNTEKALAEMLRVVKTGGHLIVAEFSSPTWRPFRTIYTNYLMSALPWIAKKTSSNPDAYIYLAESIKAWPNQAALAAIIEKVGWSKVEVRNLTGGIVAVHMAVKP